ncbi:MAG: hypothetical protein ACM3ML_02325 [Micromonosporaceae bacterium]
MLVRRTGLPCRAREFFVVGKFGPRTAPGIDIGRRLAGAIRSFGLNALADAARVTRW